MNWTLAALLSIVSGLPATSESGQGVVPAQASSARHAAWRVTTTVAGPMTTTDPQHLGVSLEVARTGTVRGRARYQPAPSSPLGFVQAALGYRLVSSDRWTLAADVEHAQVWSTRVLFRTPGFQFERHEQRWLNLGVMSATPNDRRWLGLIDGVEIGAGRMYIRDMAAGRDASVDLNEEPILILKSAASVGMAGVSLSRSLLFGFDGQVHLRVIGGGRSRGGEVPFAHLTAEWDVTRRVFESKKFGRATVGLTGTNSSSPRAVTYFQNGLGVAFRLAF